MISIIRWLLGYVKFTFLNGFTEGFINDCFKNNLNIRNISEIENGITASADIKTYFRLHRIAFRHGGALLNEKDCRFSCIRLKIGGEFLSVWHFPFFLYRLWEDLSGM